MDDFDGRTVVATFTGSVRCRRDGGASPGLTLVGALVDRPQERLILTFVGAMPPELPPALSSPSIEALDDEGHYRIIDSSGDWRVTAQAAYAHRDVRAAFHQVVPPRRVPWKKRLLLRLLLLLAGNPAGRWMLRALRAR